MILDMIANAKQYKGIHPGIDRILASAIAYTSDNYPCGRVTLDADELYMNLEEFETHSRERGRLEAHCRYIDVMYMVEGTETIYVKPAEKLQKLTTEYIPERDVMFAELDEDVTAVRLEAGSFVVLFPQDAHAPGCITERAEKVKKIVGKVKISS